MKLSVPFLFDEKYTEFLNDRIQSIESVYFSFPAGPVLDARMRTSDRMQSDEMMHQLVRLGHIKKYALFNTRFIHPGLYADPQFLNQTLDELETLLSKASVTGIVFSDAYLLNALGASNRKIVSQLEAVPGINCMLDDPDKIFSILNFIETAGFKTPGKIILDRCLNRNISLLEKTVRIVRKSYPDIKFELLANEGCIHLCPFKLTHDAQISFANIGTEKNNDFFSNRTFSINREVGCHDYFFKNPQQFLKSPFIRPEDIDTYSGLADTIKICGRTLGTKFLTQCVEAYSKKSYSGNLLKLMDATNWLADLYHIENKNLDPDFLNAVTHCTKECKKCNICVDLFENASTKKSIGLKAYKDYL